MFRQQSPVLPQSHTSSSIKPFLFLQSFAFLLDSEKRRGFALDVTKNYKTKKNLIITILYFRFDLVIIKKKKKCANFLIASVRLWFLRNFGLCSGSTTSLIGNWLFAAPPAGADTLLVMLDEDVLGHTFVFEVVGVFMVDESVVICCCWIPSLSVQVVDDTVELLVVAEFGDCCLIKKS